MGEGKDLNALELVANGLVRGTLEFADESRKMRFDGHWVHAENKNSRLSLAKGGHHRLAADGRHDGKPRPDVHVTVNEGIMGGRLLFASALHSALLLEGERRHPPSDLERERPKDGVSEVNADQVDVLARQQRRDNAIAEHRLWYVDLDAFR